MHMQIFRHGVRCQSPKKESHKRKEEGYAHCVPSVSMAPQEALDATSYIVFKMKSYDDAQHFVRYVKDPIVTHNNKRRTEQQTPVFGHAIVFFAQGAWRIYFTILCKDAIELLSELVGDFKAFLETQYLEFRGLEKPTLQRSSAVCTVHFPSKGRSQINNDGSLSFI